MDGPTLSLAMDQALTAARYDQLAPEFSKALSEAGCNTVNRVAMFCAQVGQESVGLRYMEEIASGSAYEGRRDLGNTQRGDGVRFKGRGPIQVTGRNNYASLSRWAHDKGYVPTATYFIDDPAKLSELSCGFLGAVWYWVAARNMNSYADRGDILGATKAVNGGTNGLAERTRRWNLCLSLGNRLLPAKPGYPTPTDNVVYQSKIQPGQKGSDSVWWVQKALNSIRFTGGANLTMNGNYDAATVAEVKKFQTQVCHDTADGALGPIETALLFRTAHLPITLKGN